MPAFGADMATGTLIEWQVAAGDSVKRGDVIAVIETNKGAIELDIFEDTIIEALLVEVGDEVQVGSRIATLQGPAADENNDSDKEEPEGLATSEERVVESANAAKAAKQVETPMPSDSSTPLENSNFVLATPAARHQAANLGIDLTILASQHNRPIRLQDLPNEEQAAAPGQVSSVSEPTAQPDAKQMMRDAISDTVTLSKQTIPHYYLSQRLDITELQHFVTTYNQDKEPDQRVLLAAPLLTAVAQLLHKHSQLNGQYLNKRFVPSKSVHLSHAVNVRGTGLIMPVIRDAQTFDAVRMMQMITQQVAQARRGRLPMSQLTGATCCVSSIGERGAEQMSAIIQPPQVAIVALGSPHQQALVIEDEIKVRQVVVATLAADHRVSDGHIGAKFLYQLNKLIQQPESLWTDNN
jgi:pyruvate dehydrogenase E2 component (dihydrolipoamide acetyltransferase)